MFWLGSVCFFCAFGGVWVVWFGLVFEPTDGDGDGDGDGCMMRARFVFADTRIRFSFLVMHSFFFLSLVFVGRRSAMLGSCGPSCYCYAEARSGSSYDGMVYLPPTHNARLMWSSLVREACDRSWV